MLWVSVNNYSGSRCPIITRQKGGEAGFPRCGKKTKNLILFNFSYKFKTEKGKEVGTNNGEGAQPWVAQPWVVESDTTRHAPS